MANREIKTPESVLGPSPQSQDKEKTSEGAPKPDSPESPCTVCTLPSKTTCCGCNAVYYCTRTCQKSDWKRHRTICKSLANPPTRPVDGNQEFVLGFYFPADRKNATLIYVPVSNTPGTVDEDVLTNLIGPFVGCFSAIDLDIPNAEPTFMLFFRKKALCDGSVENKCLKRINDNVPFRGPALLFRSFSDVKNLYHPILFDVEPKDFALYFKSDSLYQASHSMKAL